jgi:hypothetical protein
MKAASTTARPIKWKPNVIGAFAFALVSFIGTDEVFGQECPRVDATGPNIPSEVQTLQGKLIYHNGIRRWFELKLNRPQCGEKSIQLLKTNDNDAHVLERIRGCWIKAKGSIDFSPTGYYSSNIFMNAESVEPVGNCLQQAAFPDYSGAKPDATVNAYKVQMSFIYSFGDHPIVFHVSSGGRKLQPWEAYASYQLTGGYVLYGRCGEGFVVDKVFGTPEAKPTHFDDPRTPEDMAEYDPEGAAQSGKIHLHLGYTCVRSQ